MSARLAPVFAVAVAIWIFDDAVKVWGPSLITIFGQAAQTPAELMGLYALGCLLAPFALLALARRWSGVAWAILGVALLARAAVPFVGGGQAQLWIASIGVASVVAWLAIIVSRNAGALAASTALGLLLAAGVHAALGTWGAVWRIDAWSIVLLVVQLGLAAWTAPAALAGADRLPRRRAWFFLPALLVAGIALANVGRASTIDPVLGPVLVVAGCLLALLAAAAPSTLVSRVVAALVLVASAGASLLAADPGAATPGVLPGWVLVAFAVGPPALVHLLRGPGLAGRSAGFAVAGGGIVWVLLFFAFYAGYDLGYRADAVIVVAAAVIGFALVPGRDVAGERRPVPLAAVAAVPALLLAAFGPALTIAPVAELGEPEAGAEGEPLDVVAYNLRMGYGMDGRFDPVAVARVLDGADVALVSEIDRGWLLNGGQDQLAILGRLTGSPVFFAPAADQVWGDAILTRLPAEAVVGTPLPDYGAVTGAGMLSLRTDWGGEPLWLVSTHVQPTEMQADGTIQQVGDLAATLRERAAEGLLIVGGDFNLEPGTPSWQTILDAGVVDALAAARPLPSSDSLEPTTQIDHIFVSPGIRPSDAHTVDTTASDHLPVRVTLARE